MNDSSTFWKHAEYLHQSETGHNQCDDTAGIKSIFDSAFTLHPSIFIITHELLVFTFQPLHGLSPPSNPPGCFLCSKNSASSRDHPRVPDSITCLVNLLTPVHFLHAPAPHTWEKHPITLYRATSPFSFKSLLKTCLCWHLYGKIKQWFGCWCTTAYHANQYCFSISVLPCQAIPSCYLSFL